MTSPGLVRAALAVSTIVTGGTIYYYVSNGGDPKIAQEKMEHARDRLVIECENLHVKGVDGLEQAKDILGKAGVKANSILSKSSGAITADATSTENENENSKGVQSSSGIGAKPFCHTCSGPRIWFFAEKLRLKRRLTPYPDPPRD